jgi:hypothetical protein
MMKKAFPETHLIPDTHTWESTQSTPWGNLNNKPIAWVNQNKAVSECTLVEAHPAGPRWNPTNQGHKTPIKIPVSFAEETERSQDPLEEHKKMTRLFGRIYIQHPSRFYLSSQASGKASDSAATKSTSTNPQIQHTFVPYNHLLKLSLWLLCFLSISPFPPHHCV